MYSRREAHGFATILIRTLFAAALVYVGAAGALAQNGSQNGSQNGNQNGNAPIMLYGHVPPVVAVSQALHRAPAYERVDLALTLPLRNQAELNDLLVRLHDPNDPLCGHYLTPDQFAERFGPNASDYAALANWARANRLRVTGMHSNRLVLDVSGTAAAVENAFSLRLSHFQAADGTLFRAPESEPVVPASVAEKLANVVGLDTAAVLRPHNRVLAANVPGWLGAELFPHTIGTGPGGGMTPSDIRGAYNLNGTGRSGAGQTLAVFELDGYHASDITSYESSFGLPNVPLTNVLVDGFSGAAGSGAGEVTLDIELVVAVAPGASRIMVYEGPNSGAGVIDTYNHIATDNAAKQISTSWGLAELNSSSSMRNSENTIFQQMAAQGQTIYAAAGDSGAYDNGSSLSVDDPASQPYMTGVGGTTLATNGAGGTWKSEKTWNGGSVNAGAGGGGISAVWGIPSYQSGVISAASKGSATMRNVPDVALNADPNTGYAIRFNNAWYIFGGTSCAAPLWAGFTALVNEQRVATAKGTLGFANPALYNVGKNTGYTSDFHDIADGSTNLYYPTVTSYDLATGLGSFNGLNLFTALAGAPTGGGGGGGGTTGQLLGNPGFENGTNAGPWVASAGVIDSSTSEPAHTGSWKAWLDGYGATHTDTLYQQVAIPSTISSATLTFWLHIDSSETTTATAYDRLQVQIRNSAGTVLATLATYSNLNKAAGYTQKSFDLTAYKGQTIRVYLAGTEDSSLQTSFVVDDFALNVK